MDFSEEVMNDAYHLGQVVSLLILYLSPIITQLDSAGAIKYDPVVFDRIPVLRVHSGNMTYELGADFSIDFGDETQIFQNNNATSVNNMKLNKSDLALQLNCETNNLCGTSLAPTTVSVYLVDSNIDDKQIAEESVPTLRLIEQACENKSIEKCSDLNFFIPGNVLFQNYKIVIDLSFDEAKWIYINPIKIRE